jgi:hypothetical protein
MMSPAAIAVAALGLVGPLSAAQAPSAPVTVPFEMLSKGRLFSGHIAVQVTINGKGPYRLIFDTGAPIMLVTSKLAKECELLGPGGKKPPARSLFAMPGQVTIGKVQLGEVTAVDLPAIVLDHPTVSAIAQVFGPIEGIVGFPFFARYRTAIDYQAKELTFTPSNYRPANVVESLMTSLVARTADRGKSAKPRILAPAAQWGFRPDKQANDDDPGVDIAEIMPDSSAARAGLQIGDRLLTLGGRWTDSVADVFEAASHVKPQQEVELRLLRSGQERRISIAPALGF